MTAIAIGRRRSEVGADMAARARNADVRPREWKNGFAVVERGGRPGYCCMADGAGRGNPRLQMVRAGGAIEIFDVTRGTVGGRTIEFAARVARGAIQSCMRSDESEPSGLQMVEFRSGPTIGEMAGFTSRREVHRYVARIARSLIIL